jgi:YidC/Oxa1 family membrane protein insertase
MDKNTIIGLVLIFAIFIGFSILNQPSKEEIERRQRIQDSIAQVNRQRDSLLKIKHAESEEIAEVEKREVDTTLSQEQLALENLDRLGVFASSATGASEEYLIENEHLRIWISNVGGKIINVELKEYKTFDSLPLVLFNNDDLIFGYTFFANSRRINTDKLYFQPIFKNQEFSADREMMVSGSDSLLFAMRLYTDNPDGTPDKNRYIEYLYTVYGDDYMIGYKLNLVGMDKVIDHGSGFIDLNWEAEMRRQEKSLVNERNESTVYWKYDKESVKYLSERKDAKESLKLPVKWVSFKSRFFVATLIADQSFTNAEISSVTDPKNTDDHYLKNMSALVAVPFGNEANQSFDMNFYFGPNKYKTLKQYDLDLERQVPLGWSFFLIAWINIYAVINVFNWLGDSGLNYGIVILILTVLLKLVLLPIAYKTYKSTAKMRILKPEIDEIAKKFPKPEDAMKKQQATMTLYKKAGVNPMAGCVPQLLQFPILIAMFRFFPSSIELRQQSFLWAHDLSSYDSILDLPFNIPFYGSHVSLFTLLMTISTIIYTKINNKLMRSSKVCKQTSGYVGVALGAGPRSPTISSPGLIHIFFLLNK